MSETPCLPEVGMLAMVPDSFLEPWQSRHQILTRMSHYFYVVWVEPATEWRDILWSRRKAGACHAEARSLRRRAKAGVRELDDERTPAFVVYTPDAWLPLVFRPAWLARLLERTRLTRARRLLVERGCRQIVVSLWRPEFEQALTMVPRDLAMYHIDDEYTFSSVEGARDERELRLLEAVDVVSVHSPGLLRRKGHINPKTVFIPNGVDYAAYATAASEPADLAAIPHPRIGYTGYLKSKLDWDLLRELIVSHREWQFVFVGPRRPHTEVGAIVQALAREPNAHFLGSKGREELAAYPQHFDVCIMPYRLDAYATCIYPLKLHEYLASGRPVIGTGILTLREFADVVTLANTAPEWSVAIAAALAPAANVESRRLARQAVARRHDWRTIALRMAVTIADGLGPEVRRRLDDALAETRRPAG
jgi:glycosyltransferase involved in cell wall biosynthesis